MSSIRIHPADERLADAIVRGIQSDTDPRTIEIWSRTAAKSPGALRTCCIAAGIRPKSVLDFVRLYRAVTLATETGLRLADFLDVVDPRTLSNLLKRGGLCGVEKQSDREAFLKAQQLITGARLLPLITNSSLLETRRAS